MIVEAIDRLVRGESLTGSEAAGSMEEIMDGAATPAQISALLVALRMKGETIEEITGLARVMRSRATPVELGEYETEEHERWRAEKLPWSGWRRDPERVG